MDFAIQGKVALVAAATSGLGFAAAECLRAEGAKVAICGRDSDKLAEAARALDPDDSGEVLAERVDVTDAGALNDWVRGVAEHFGRIDIVVANNGGVPVGQATDYGPEHYLSAVTTAMLPAITLIQAAVPYLRRAETGRVLIVTSEAIERTPRHFALSSVARSGLVPFARVLTQELGAANVTVNVLAPGAHRTRIHEANRHGPCGAGVREMERRIPLQRIGEPSEFGAVVAFLASDRASFINGTVLPVDGGLSVAV
jgi:3-oxoacyl-[acyl-carrier protein] reductase